MRLSKRATTSCRSNIPGIIFSFTSVTSIFFSDTLTQDHKERETRTNLTTVAISQIRDSQFFFLLLDEYTECW